MLGKEWLRSSVLVAPGGTPPLWVGSQRNSGVAGQSKIGPREGLGPSAGTPPSLDGTAQQMVQPEVPGKLDPQEAGSL